MVHTQQSRALVFPKGGWHYGAGPRVHDQSCFSAWVDHTHGWSLCGLLTVGCVQGVRRGDCQPHKAAQPRLPEGRGAWGRCATRPGFEEASGQPMVFQERKPRPSFSSIEISAAQTRTSARATSTPAGAVHAVGEGIARIPAVAVLPVDDGAAQADGVRCVRSASAALRPLECRLWQLTMISHAGAARGCTTKCEMDC